MTDEYRILVTKVKLFFVDKKKTQIISAKISSKIIIITIIEYNNTIIQ